MANRTELHPLSKPPLAFWAKFSAETWFFVFLFVSFVKTLLWTLVVLGNLPLFGWVLGPESGNDSEYYDAYARGLGDYATSFWPVLLRFLNELGFYSRQAVSALNMALGVWVTPLLMGSLSARLAKQRWARQRILWFGAAVVALYPSLFFFTLDIYRDVFMLALFSLGMYVAVLYFSTNSMLKLGYLGVLMALTIILWLFRGYLGFAFGVGLVLAKALTAIRFERHVMLGGLLLYLAGIYLAKNLGLLEAVLEYRGDEGFTEGGSSFGIALIGRSGVDFWLAYALSFTYQVFGLYINSPKALLIFVLESLPFIYFLWGIWRNRLKLDVFSKFLLLFALVYTTIFVMGNDNLGTAIRLRFFSYLAIFAVWLRLQARLY